MPELHVSFVFYFDAKNDDEAHMTAEDIFTIIDAEAKKTAILFKGDYEVKDYCSIFDDIEEPR